jgi:uncharacterized protein
VAEAVALNPFIVKIASRCNLNCSYCYIYNQADTGWRSRPAVMSDETFDATIDRIRGHCVFSGQDVVMLLFHGGEPTLVGAKRFQSMCSRARERLKDVADVSLGIQTNATRLTDEWIDVLQRQDVQVGISMDGPKDVHDVFRVDHKGRGSYDAVARGVMLLRQAGTPFTILSVVQFGQDPLRIHHHFLDLGCKSISYLLPACTHETIGAIREQHGPTPCADFLIPIFDDWWFESTIDVRIREFWNIGRVLLGGESQLDSIGNPPLRFVGIETDGSMEGLDKLRACEDGMTEIGLSVRDSDFRDIARVSAFHHSAMSGMPLPQVCMRCLERDTCGGGYLPHRYSRDRGFDNPSVWCADLLLLFAHVRHRMNVSQAETASRRLALRKQPAHAAEC